MSVSGSNSDVWEGILGGSKVCVKRVRMHALDSLQTTAEVRYQCRRFSYSPLLTELTDVLPRGCHLEKPVTPKDFTIPRCHYQSPPNRFELDAWWNPPEVHQGHPQRRSAWTGRCLA